MHNVIVAMGVRGSSKVNPDNHSLLIVPVVGLSEMEAALDMLTWPEGGFV